MPFNLQGVVKAVASVPQNVYCQRIVTEYIDIILLWMETPWDVALYRKSKSNRFHEGGSAGQVEMIEASKDAKNSWAAECLSTKRNTTNCPTSGDLSFLNLKKNHIMTNFKETFGQHSVFQDATEFYNYMIGIDAWDDYKQLVTKRQDFLHAGSKRPEIIVTNSAKLCAVILRFQDAHNLWVVKTVLLEALCLLFPQIDPQSPVEPS